MTDAEDQPSPKADAEEFARLMGKVNDLSEDDVMDWLDFICDGGQTRGDWQHYARKARDMLRVARALR